MLKSAKKGKPLEKPTSFKKGAEGDTEISFDFNNNADDIINFIVDINNIEKETKKQLAKF